jgi:DtxR family Mn-dependent transcriptional regulator
MDSRSIEDYLKAIYGLQANHTRAKTSQLARKLSVTAGTVSEMLKRLAAQRPPLVIYKHHQGVRLSDHGRQMALNVIRRHRLLETFLHQTLGLSWDEVHQEAEILEHCLSARVTDALDRFLGHPSADPHGEPIPDVQGRMPPHSSLTLSALAEGKRFRVMRVQPVSADLLQYLESEEIQIGTTGILISRAPFEGPLTLALDGDPTPRKIVIGRTVGRRIYVEALRGPSAPGLLAP